MGRAFRSLVVLSLIALIPAAVEALYLRDRMAWRQPPAQDEIDLATAIKLQPLWLDARSNDDFARAHIPGAMSLNAESWDELLPTVLKTWAPGTKIVVYCSAKSCDASREVARRLREEAGLKNVYVLTGGWEAWQNRSR